MTESDGAKVPPVVTSDDNDNLYPYYLHTKDGVKVYRKYWYRMLDAVAKHIKRYAQNPTYQGLRDKIVVFQSAEGSTGDEGPYHGEVTNGDNFKINRSSTEWIQFKQDAWQHLYDLYNPPTPLTPKIHLLVNCDPEDPEDLGNGGAGTWVQENIENTWRKASNAGHGYQLNEEKDIKRQFNYLINTPTPTNNSKATLIRCRDEMDQYSTPLFLTAPKWHIYCTALSALHFGLDIWPNNAAGIKDPANNNKPAFDIFTRYAGYKNPKFSEAAFCALRDGLDAGDFDRFKIIDYGDGTSLNDNGKIRCENIKNAFAVHGAMQGRPRPCSGWFAKQ